MWFIVWVVFALIVGMMGSDKKIGFWGAFIISLILSPVVGFIIVMVSGSNEEAVQEIKAVAEKMTEPKKSVESRLFDLKELKEKNLITEEEYDQMRQDILKDA
jgi:hypothetical protein